MVGVIDGTDALRYDSWLRNAAVKNGTCRSSLDMTCRLALPSRHFLLLVPLSLALLFVGSARPANDWQPLSPGMDLKYVAVHRSGASTDARITVLRIDAHLWELQAIGTSSTGEKSNHTAREWCASQQLTAAINAGMFNTDGKTHVGLMRFREHTNNGKANSYLSVAAFDPRDASRPPFRIFDLDAPQVTTQSILADYGSAIQNLRLIKHPGTNQWTQQTRMWSEAALGEDEAGRVLFIFSRTPFSMHDLNEQLLAAGIGLVAAQHLEGGPEAQLYVHVGKLEIELLGSYETSFREDDSNATPWPIPNVLGVRPKSTYGSGSSK